MAQPPTIPIRGSVYESGQRLILAKDIPGNNRFRAGLEVTVDYVHSTLRTGETAPPGGENFLYDVKASFPVYINQPGNTIDSKRISHKHISMTRGGLPSPEPIKANTYVYLLADFYYLNPQGQAVIRRGSLVQTAREGPTSQSGNLIRTSVDPNNRVFYRLRPVTIQTRLETINAPFWVGREYFRAL